MKKRGPPSTGCPRKKFKNPSTRPTTWNAYMYGILYNCESAKHRTTTTIENGKDDVSTKKTFSVSLNTLRIPLHSTPSPSHLIPYDTRNRKVQSTKYKYVYQHINK